MSVNFLLDSMTKSREKVKNKEQHILANKFQNVRQQIFEIS